MSEPFYLEERLLISGELNSAMLTLEADQILDTENNPDLDIIDRYPSDWTQIDTETDTPSTDEDIENSTARIALGQVFDLARISAQDRDAFLKKNGIFHQPIPLQEIAEPAGVTNQTISIWNERAQDQLLELVQRGHHESRDAWPANPKALASEDLEVISAQKEATENRAIEDEKALAAEATKEQADTVSEQDASTIEGNTTEQNKELRQIGMLLINGAALGFGLLEIVERITGNNDVSPIDTKAAFALLTVAAIADISYLANNRD